MKKVMSVMFVGLMVLGGFIGFLNITAGTVEGAGLANTPWPMFHGNLRHTGLSPYDTSHVDGTQKWNFTTGGDVRSSPAIGSNGTIYVGSWDNKLYAIRPGGMLKWTYTTGYYVFSSPVIGSDGTIYVGSDDNKLYAIRPDGTQKWAYTTGDEVASSPAIGDDGTIYIGSYDHRLYAIRPDGTLKWSYTTGGRVQSTPAIGSDGTIYIGSWDNKLYAINPDGTLKWTYTTGDKVASSPAIGGDGTIYVGSYDNKLYAIRPDGTLKWAYTTGGDAFSSPAIGSDGTIYVGSEDNKLYAINPDGTLKWNFTTGYWVSSSPAIGSDGTIYVGSWDHKLYAIRPDGTLKWNLNTGGYVASSPAIGSDGTIYVGSNDHKLYAIGPTKPSAPQNLQASAGDGQITLTWNPPADDGGSSITEYKIYRGNSSDGETYYDSVDRSTTTYKDTGVDNGITYYYQVRAVNSVDEGPNSSEVNATPQGAPLTPQNLQASAGDGQITLTWNPPADDGGSSITEYKIYRGTRSGGETLLTTVGNMLTYTDTNVSNGVTYYYHISAVNAVGEGPNSSEVSATPQGLPSPPQNLTVRSGDGNVTLSWSPSGDDGGSTITEYRIYRGTSSGAETYLANVSGTTTHYTDTGVTNGQTYYYKVSAVNSLGEGDFSSEDSVIPQGVPSPPQNLQATAGDGYVVLSWNKPNNNGGSKISAYYIYRGTSSGEEAYYDSVGGTVTSYTDKDVNNGQTYYYKVSAVNDIGEGSRSNESSATPTSTRSGGSTGGGQNSGGGNLDLLVVIIIIVVGFVVAYILGNIKKKEPDTEEEENDLEDEELDDEEIKPDEEEDEE